MHKGDLRPAGELANQYGVKALVYGAPGTGKTPLIGSLPRPVILATEPGLLSMKGSTIPTWEADTCPKIEEFFQWFNQSHEANEFDSLAIDSVSQMAEIYLKKNLKKERHGLKAYGNMATEVMEHLETLYYRKYKHIYLIAKMVVNDEGGGTLRKRPYFPGKELNVKIPHLYDEILFIDHVQVQGQQGMQKAIRTQGTINIEARDRSGKLAELEPWDMGALFNKCMS